ncbi:MAG: PRC-barrel domain-containing protein [Hyphomicrobiaceae bacterium]
MKKTLASMLALGLVLAAPAHAQAQSAAKDIYIDAQSNSEYLAKDHLIGAKVHNDEGKIIGDIEDLVLNDYNGVEGVVMGTGGFFGLAEKKVGVRLSALTFKEKDGKAYVTLPGITAELLKDVEPFKRAKPAKTLLERAMEKAQEFKDKGSVTAKDAYDKAKEQAGPAYERAKEAAKETYDAAKEAVKSAADKAKEGATPSKPQ